MTITFFRKQRASNLIDVEVSCDVCRQWISATHAWIYPDGRIKCILCNGKRINLLHDHKLLKGARP